MTYAKARGVENHLWIHQLVELGKPDLTLGEFMIAINPYGRYFDGYTRVNTSLNSSWPIGTHTPLRWKDLEGSHIALPTRLFDVGIRNCGFNPTSGLCWWFIDTLWVVYSYSLSWWPLYIGLYIQVRTDVRCTFRKYQGLLWPLRLPVYPLCYSEIQWTFWEINVASGNSFESFDATIQM